MESEEKTPEEEMERTFEVGEAFLESNIIKFSLLNYQLMKNNNFYFSDVLTRKVEENINKAADLYLSRALASVGVDSFYYAHKAVLLKPDIKPRGEYIMNIFNSAEAGKIMIVRNQISENITHETGWERLHLNVTYSQENVDKFNRFLKVIKTEAASEGIKAVNKYEEAYTKFMKKVEKGEVDISNVAQHDKYFNIQKKILGS